MTIVLEIAIVPVYKQLQKILEVYDKPYDSERIERSNREKSNRDLVKKKKTEFMFKIF